MTNPLTVILDFDGTVTLKDLGLHVTYTFSHDSDAIATADRAFERGELSIEELYRVELDTLRAEDFAAMQAEAMAAVQVRDGFPEFIQFCQANGIPVEIASSGMKFYIDALLKRLGVSQVPVAAPVVEFNATGRGTFRLDNGATACGITAMCKCERIWRQRRLGRTVLFVGDGSSDHCAALQADHVMARESLARYCETEEVNYTPFEDFYEVKQMVTALTGVR